MRKRFLSRDMLQKYLMQMANYNVWANTAICNYLSTADDHLFHEPVSGSFPTLKDLLVHMWGAELLWFKRLNGDSPTSFAADSTNLARAQLLDALISESTKFPDFIAQLDDAALTQSTRYARLNGEQYEQPTADILQHVFNHSTYHRGQLVVYARALNLSRPPSTDLILYLR